MLHVRTPTGNWQYYSSELWKQLDNIDRVKVKFLAISESDLNTVTLEVGREETIARDEESEIEQNFHHSGVCL